MGLKRQAGILGLIIFVVDAVTKYWVHSSLPHVATTSGQYPYGGIPVFQDLFGIEFSISHMTNTGAAWGAFGEHQSWLLAFRILLIGALCLYFALRSSGSYVFPLALIISGAIGNVIDTFVYGHVVDMLQFKFWGYQYPWFNVADTAICIGVFWMAALSLRQPVEQTL